MKRNTPSLPDPIVDGQIQGAESLSVALQALGRLDQERSIFPRVPAEVLAFQPGNDCLQGRANALYRLAVIGRGRGLAVARHALMFDGDDQDGNNVDGTA